jgi:hypothetical protein
MVKTLYRRLCAKAQYAEAGQLCVDLAARFSRVGEFELAANLGQDLVSSLELRQEPPTDENLSQIEAILQGIPSNAASSQKYALINKALKWSGAVCTTGHPRLHRIAALSHWADGEFGKCQGHYVFCGDGPGLAKMVREWRQKGYAIERDLFSLRVLLILLSLNDIATARSFWDVVNEGEALDLQVVETDADFKEANWSYEERAIAAEKALEAAVPEPALQFGTFLLAAAESRSIKFFRIVRSKYTLVSRRDRTFDKYLDEIEAKVFGSRAQPNGIGALFDLLLGSGDSPAPAIPSSENSRPS